MWSMNTTEADAAAAFALSSPDVSEFGSSPAGRALRKAREECDSVFFAPFQDSPSPKKALDSLLESSAGRHSVHSLSAANPLACPPSVEETTLHRIAAAVADSSDGSFGLDGEFESDAADDDEYAVSVEASEDDHQDRYAPRARTTPSATPVTKSSAVGVCRALFTPSSSAGQTPSSASSSTLASTQSALALVSATGCGKLTGKTWSLEQQRSLHDALGATAFCTFKCSCPMSKSNDSCLEEGFDRSSFRSLHHHTYGRLPNLHTVAEVKAAVHTSVWELRQPLPGPRYDGRLFSVPVWRLGGPAGRIVCRKAFITAVGGTPNAHREALTLTIAGKDPADAKAKKSAACAIKALERVPSSRADWARSWWKQHLMWQDWLPNQMTIQYRGPTWNLVYDEFYRPIAAVCKMVLKPKQWMRQRKHALDALQSKFFPTVTDKKLTCVRSARHSKFPECTDCQKKRVTYKNLASNPKAPASAVAAAYEDMVAHALQWQADRETALDLRNRYSILASTFRYTVDDKCGSFWQMLPVSVTGRDTKENAKDRYKFSVHANVVCGESGHKRFTFVPKNVSTGGNFGLTNLLMTIYLAVQSGNLKPHTDSLVRHTDGGPDNVSVVTHFFHWLLVYLGVFNKVLWFRFKAGHSHTEVADRLFSLIKRHFESDGAHRVTPIEDFVSLIQKVSEDFAQEAESCTFHWNFANWDLRCLMKEMNVVSSSLKGISSKMAYQYVYDESRTEHGCVLVQYKTNISWQGNAREAEWSPIMRVEREMNIGEADDEAQLVECNVSRPKGVQFVVKPPDLRIKPRREPFDTKDEDKNSPSKQCKGVLNKRWSDLTPSSRSFWKCLSLFHAQAADTAERVPDLPHTVHTEERAFTFDGSPKPFADVMQAMMLRFPRPLLPPNPFNSAPAESWEAAAQNMHSATPSTRRGLAGGEADQVELRDPRRENTVQNLELSAHEMRANSKELAEEEFATLTPTRVEAVELDQLYLCELEAPEHGLRLGLGMPLKEGPNNEEGMRTWTVAWFKISSKKGWKTKNITFEPHKIRGRHQTDDLDIRSFRLCIDNKDLTKQGLANKNTYPKFTGGFTDRVLAFARCEGLDEHETEDELDPTETDDEADEEEEECHSADEEGDDEDESDGHDEEESDGDGGASAEEEGEMGDDREEEGGEADAAKEGVPHSQSLSTRRLKRPHAPTSTRMPATKGKRGVAQGPACTGASRVAHDSSDDEGLAPAKAAAACSSQLGSRDKEAGTTTVATHQSEKVCIQLRAGGRGDGGDGGVLVHVYVVVSSATHTLLLLTGIDFDTHTESTAL